MKVGIVGSHRRKDRDAVRDLVEGLPKGSIVVSGGRKGVDTWAIELAREFGFKTVEFYPYVPPEDCAVWTLKNSQKTQNQKIINSSDVIYAFVAEDREGTTESLVKLAEKSGVPVEIVEPE
jgi:uncharacterized phage-like protein YoqJ